MEDFILSQWAKWWEKKIEAEDSTSFFKELLKIELLIKKLEMIYMLGKNFE